jgi:hypothetical protein
MDLAKKARAPRFFVAQTYLRKTATHRLIVATAGPVLENTMVPDQTNIACQFAARIVIDDRCRLPGRFFGRFTTSATSGLARAI